MVISEEESINVYLKKFENTKNDYKNVKNVNSKK